VLGSLDRIARMSRLLLLLVPVGPVLLTFVAWLMMTFGRALEDASR